MSGTIGTVPTPEATVTTPPVTGVNTGITPANPVMPTATATDGAVRSVRQLARDAGAVTDMPVDPVPAIADKPKSAVPISKDVKPTSVRGLANAAGARR
jgi:hypothetical protein